MVTTALTDDFRALDDAQAARRYFAKFGRILTHLDQVVAREAETHGLHALERDAVTGYLRALAGSFEALSYKYLMAGWVSTLLPKALDIDTTDSGFPVHAEFLQMANDAQQVAQRLGEGNDPEALKAEMVDYILTRREHPLKLQYALSQRLYYEALARGPIFWARNDPHILWVRDREDGSRDYLVHWAVHDSQVNIPVIYLMRLVDSGGTALARDEGRWPQAQDHLMAQSLLGLTLVTIATGFDRDFDDLHPKELRRIQVGPMYSHSYTRQTGPLGPILEQAAGAPGSDWALAWTVETLLSDRVQWERKGLFGKVSREIYRLDHFAGQPADMGATDRARAIILPQRPYQVLEETDPPGFRGVRKHVVGDEGRVVSYG